ncbi:MAG: PKD domain-containing protein, partial [Thermoanaerobaculaceae bacterium]|nr:PKD domain-containing protein [Thermoanaerobaculaceae bacterium]
MRFKLILFLIFSLVAGLVFGSEFNAVSPFVENLGQVDNSILFYSQNSWGNVVVQRNGIVFEIKDGEEHFKNLYLKFKNYEKIEIIGENPSETYFNFIKGLEADKWIKDVKVYENLRVTGISKNEDFLISSSQSGKPFLSIQDNLKNYFYLDADIPAQFDDGHLTVQLKNGTFELNLTQKIQDFYDKSPESQSIVFSTYLGGTYSDHAFDLALDQSGNVVVSGNTYSTDIPVPNGYDTTKGTTCDMYIAKLSSDGQNLLWGTYIGGTYEEAAFSVKVNSLGEIVFGGRANADTPAPNVTQSSENYQIYIGKLSSDGRNLLFGTKLGGGQLSRLVLDSSDNIYFVAHTSKSNLACLNGYDCSFNGGPSDLYIGKLNSSGTLVGSTYLGGSDSDGNEYQYSFSSFDYSIGPCIALDFDGNIIVATKTESTNIPIVGGYQQTFKGNADLYIVKLSSDCSNLLASTYLGGSSIDLIGGLAVEGQNNIIVAGNSRSTDMPVLNAYQSTNKSDSGKEDGYVAKLNSNLSQLIFGTYIGGKNIDLIRAISVDGGGNILITGVTYSTDFPLANPLQSGLSSSSSNDNFISLLGKTGNTLLESTYFGGNYAESPYSIIFSPFDNALICGRTSSRNFPTANAYRNTLTGEWDIFVSKLSMSSLASCNITCSANVPYRAKPNENVSFTSTISVDPEGCSSYSVLWDFGDGSTSTELNPTHKYTTEGSYSWKLKVTGNNAPNCNKSGVIVITNSLCEIECSATVPPWAMLNSPVTFSASANSSQCPDPITYLWDFGDGSTSTEQNPVHTYTKKGTYTWKLTVSSGIVNCEKSDTIYIDTERPCVEIGDLKFCADLINTDGSKYTLSGDVSVNNILFFTNTVEVIKINSATGSLYTIGNLYVKNIDGSDETILKGPFTTFVDGIYKSFTEMDGPPIYDLNLLNLPLEVNGSEISIEDDGILVTPFLNIGVEPVILARVQMSLLLVPNETKHILSVEVVDGSLTPSITVSSFSLTYNPQEQSITGSASIGLPFLDVASIDASVEFKPGCLDGFSIKIGLPQGIPLGTSGLEIDGFILEVDNLCEPAHLYIFIGGDIAIAEVPSEIIALEHVGLGYQVPYTLIIDGGTLSFLGYGLASMGGTICVNPPSVSAYG